MRKRRIARDIYHSWGSWLGSDEWEYYDNLHQYSKNKIHCSCPYCNAKTRNKGRRGKGNYNRSLSYKTSDMRKVLSMDEDMRENGLHAPHRRKDWGS